MTLNMTENETFIFLDAKAEVRLNHLSSRTSISFC